MTNNSNDQLSEKSEFSDDLNDYQQWIEMSWKLDDKDSEDVFAMISMREDLHRRVVSEVLSQEYLNRLRNLDIQWQQWLKANRQPGFEFGFKQSHPKEEWWWWIDKLDELNPEQRSTL